MSSKLDRAWLLYSQRRFDVALTDALQVLAHEPQNSMAHALCSWCLTGLERFEESEVAARRAIECDPEDTNGWSALAGLFLRLGREREALEASDVAVSLAPEGVVLREQRARILFVQGRPGEALEEAARALEIAPEDADVHELRALAYKSLLQDADAQRACETLLEIDAERPRGHTLRGWSALHRGELDEAEAAFGEALRIDPTDQDARDGLVDLLRKRHPVLRHVSWSPKPSRVAPPSPEQAKKDEDKLASWLLWGALAASIKGTYLLGNWLARDVELTSWLAWPIGALGGVVGGTAVVLAGGFAFELVKALGAELIKLPISVVRFVVIGPLGDLILACSARGRHALTRARLRTALAIGAFLLALTLGVALAVTFGAYGVVRAAFGSLFVVPLLATCLQGDMRPYRNGFLVAAGALCAGLYLGSWSLVASAVCLAPQTLFACAAEHRRVRLGLKAGLWGTWIAIGSFETARIAVGSPSGMWSFAVAAAACLASFIVFCVDADAAAKRKSVGDPGGVRPQALPRRAA
jgi:tetratricopeptide (TPR) repeat protein